MKENQEVFLKIKGKIITNISNHCLCDMCLQWIEKGNLIGFASIDGFEIINCLTCLKETT